MNKLGIEAEVPKGEWDLLLKVQKKKGKKKKADYMQILPCPNS